MIASIIYHLKDTPYWQLPPNVYGKLYFPEVADGIYAGAEYVYPPAKKVSDLDEPVKIKLYFIANTKAHLVNKTEIQ